MRHFCHASDSVAKRKTSPRLPREKTVLCVGAIQRRKNQTALVRAFRALPEDWKLVLAGSNGYEADRTLAETDRSAVLAVAQHQDHGTLFSIRADLPYKTWKSVSVQCGMKSSAE